MQDSTYFFWPLGFLLIDEKMYLFSQKNAVKFVMFFQQMICFIFNLNFFIQKIEYLWGLIFFIFLRLNVAKYVLKRLQSSNNQSVTK